MIHVCHEQLDELLRIRISDPKLLALIGRFLKAGVMIEGQRFDTEDGVPQGSSLSPLLANVYLHYVLDQWFERDVKPRMRGEAYSDPVCRRFYRRASNWNRMR